jgi:hypothetical protein
LHERFGSCFFGHLQAQRFAEIIDILVALKLRNTCGDDQKKSAWLHNSPEPNARRTVLRTSAEHHVEHVNEDVRMTTDNQVCLFADFLESAELYQTILNESGKFICNETRLQT